MAFESEKTGRYLRAKTLNMGVEERMRALQALNHGYGTGSNASLAKMLLATLGGQISDTGPVVANTQEYAGQTAIAFGVIQQVAQTMQRSANDDTHEAKAAS